MDRGATSTQLELSLSCVDQKSDPHHQDHMIVVFEMIDAKWVEIGRTEISKTRIQPYFLQKFALEYNFFEVRILKFVCIGTNKPDIRDWDSKSEIGFLEISLPDIAAKKVVNRELISNDASSKHKYSLIINSEEIQRDIMDVEIRMQFAASDLVLPQNKKIKALTLSVYKASPPELYSLVAKTSTEFNANKIEWNPITATAQALCSCDQDRCLKLSVSMETLKGEIKVLGAFTTSLRELLSKQKKFFTLLAEDKKHKRNSASNIGVLELKQGVWRKLFSFLDYISHQSDQSDATPISFGVAIDFTYANGQFKFGSSLHHAKNERPTIYESVMLGIGNALQPYGADGDIYAFGYGAVLPELGHVSQCFPLNGNSVSPVVDGLKGLSDAYKAICPTLEFKGPNNLAPVFRLIRTIIKPCSAQNQRYYIFLVLTSSPVEDLQDSIDEIVHLSKLPISIIIAGIGDANFEELMKITSHGFIQSSWGEELKREILRFVKVKGSVDSKFIRKAFDGIESQFLNYMRINGISPLPASETKRIVRPICNISKEYYYYTQRPPMKAASVTEVHKMGKNMQKRAQSAANISITSNSPDNLVKPNYPLPAAPKKSFTKHESASTVTRFSNEKVVRNATDNEKDPSKKPKVVDSEKNRRHSVHIFSSSSTPGQANGEAELNKPPPTYNAALNCATIGRTSSKGKYYELRDVVDLPPPPSQPPTYSEFLAHAALFKPSD